MSALRIAIVGGGIGLSANAFAILAQLGHAEALATAGHTLRSATPTDRRGRVLSGADFGDVAERYGPSVAIHRAALHEVLIEAAGEPGLQWSAPLACALRDALMRATPERAAKGALLAPLADAPVSRAESA